MSCPKCGGINVRRSRRSTWVDALYAFSKRKPFRCRDCRSRFYAPESNAASDVTPPARKKHRSSDHHGPKPLFSKRARRRLIEVVIFGVMLILFLIFLRFLTREQAPASESGKSFAVRTVTA